MYMLQLEIASGLRLVHTSRGVDMQHQATGPMYNKDGQRMKV